MSDIEQKAQALVDEVRREYPLVADFHAASLALMRYIEQHEAFRQEVSDAVEAYLKWSDECLFPMWDGFDRFIIPKPKPDPLVEAMADCGVDRFESWADQLRAALEARGLEIREKNDV